MNGWHELVGDMDEWLTWIGWLVVRMNGWHGVVGWLFG